MANNFQNIEVYNNPNEGRDIINYNFSLIKDSIVDVSYSAGTLIFYNITGGTTVVTGIGTEIWELGSGVSSIQTVGTNCQATGDYSISQGINSKSSGQFSYSSGVNAESTGIASYCIGKNCKGIGNYSFAGGDSSTASSINSFAYGLSVESLGIATFAEGRRTKALGNYSHSEGIGSFSYLYGMHAKKSGDPETDDRHYQYGNVTVYSYTEDDIKKQILINNSYHITIPNNTIFNFKINGLGTSSEGLSANYYITGRAKNISGTTTVDNVSATTICDDFSIIGMNAEVDNVNKSLAITATGKAATIIYWTAFVEWVEMTFE